MKRFVGLLLAVSLFAALAASTPEPALYHECPYCSFMYLGTRGAAPGQFVFQNHKFVNLTVTATLRFETCEYQYYKHIGEMVDVMRRAGRGRLIEVKP